MALKAFPVGAYNLQVAVLNSNGIAMGQIADPDNPSTPETSHAYLVNHIVEVVPGSPTYTVATERSGQTYRGDVDLGLESLGEFTFTLAEVDLTLDALLTKGVVSQNYNTGFTQGGNNQVRATPPVVCLIFTRGRSSRDSATLNDRGYQHLIVPTCTVRATEPGANQSGGENPIPLTFTVRPGLSNKLPNGLLFNSINPNMYESGQTFWHMLDLDYRIGMTTWAADGIATTFVLGYRPLFDTATISGENWFVRTLTGATSGNNTAVTSVNTTTGLVTPTSAGSDEDIYVAIYPTDYVAI